MNNNKACAEYLKAKNLKTVMKLVNEKWKKYGRFTGFISIAQITEYEKKDLESIIGRHLGNAEKIQVMEIVEALNRTKFSPIDLREVLNEYFGKTVYTNKETKERTSLRQKQYISSLFQIIEEERSPVAVKDWLTDALEHKVNGYRIFMRPISDSCFRSCIQAVNFILSKDKEDQIPFAVFSAKITGNPHYFDKGSDAGNLFVAILSSIYKIDGNISIHNWKKVLMSAGILPDEISSTVTVFNVKLFNNQEINRGAEWFYKQGEPINLSAYNLKNITRIEAYHQCVYVVENEMVFTSLLEKIKGKEISLICTSGQFSTTASQTIDLLQQNNTTIFYGGDTDPEGLMICDKLWQKYPENVRVWRMSAKDYITSLSSEHVSDQRLSKLSDIKNPILKDTASKILEMRKSGYQENILEELEADILN